MSTLAEDLALLYPGRADEVGAALDAVLARHAEALRPDGRRRTWTQRDAILITYADSLSAPGQAPLATLADILPRLTDGTIPTVHLLPFYPWTSDDGFSVVDYLAVDPAVGTWHDVAHLRRQVELMFDAVINHVSASSPWFAGFLADDEHRDWFLVVDEDADTSSIVRPRTLPLLTGFDTARGREHVWTTFSADQVDLNYAEPAVLLAVLDVVLTYVRRGASVIRLDAVTYLWKELGTSGVHLPQTHAVIRVLRAALDAVAPDVTLITETNVPHAENVSYFGDGHDEAQLVYNFALPPLVLHSFVAGDASALSAWAAGLTTPSQETSFFNFLASHDGIGVRGAEGILAAADLTALADRVHAHGGHVSYRAVEDGSRVPYELNINYFDALSDPAGDEPIATQVARFLTAQSIMATLPGVPGIYLHSLLGSRGWPAGVALTGANRSINREKLDRDTLLGELSHPDGRRARVLRGYQRLLRVRSGQAAFDPRASAAVIDLGPGAFALLRGSGPEAVLAVHNVTAEPLPLPAAGHDLLTDAEVAAVPPFGTVWLNGGAPWAAS